MNVASVQAEQQNGRGKLTPSMLLKETYGLYRAQFWVLFRIALLPAVLVYCGPYIYRSIIRQLVLRHAIGVGTPMQFAVLIAEGWFEGAFYWVISGFFFAAVATNFLAKADSEKIALSDSYTQARTRLPAIMGVALICWTFFWLARAVAGFSIYVILQKISARPNAYLIDCLFSVPLLVMAGILSRFGLAIPELTQEPAKSVFETLRFSIKKTQNWELFFILFVAKQAVAAFVLFWLGYYALNKVAEQTTMVVSMLPWVRDIFTISLAAALESPLFIAFCLLYRDSELSEYEEISVPVIG